MKVNQIHVKIDQRIKLRDFESMAPSVEMSATLDEGDDPVKCMDELQTMARKQWAKESMKELRWHRSRSKSVESQAEFDEITGTTVTALKKMMIEGK